MSPKNGYAVWAMLAGLASGFAVPVTAQETPRPEVSAGYQLERFSQQGRFHDAIRFGRGDAITPTTGWYFDAAINVTQMIGIVAEFGGAYTSESRTQGRVDGQVNIQFHQFMTGVRVNRRRSPKIMPFGQLLVGAVRSKFRATGSELNESDPSRPLLSYDSEANTDFAVQAGGGVNVAVASNVGVRLGGDYLRLFAANEATHVFRFTAGIVLFLLK